MSKVNRSHSAVCGRMSPIARKDRSDDDVECGSVRRRWLQPTTGAAGAVVLFAVLAGCGGPETKGERTGPSAEPAMTVNTAACPVFETQGTGQVPDAGWLDGLLDIETSYSSFAAALERLLEVGGESVPGAVIDLVTPLEALTPAPRYSLEALGRIRFAGHDPVSLLGKVNSAIGEECGGQLFGSEALARVAGLRPVPADDGTVDVGYHTLWGRSCQSDPRAMAAFSGLYECGPDAIVVDFATGATYTSTGSATSARDVLVAGDRLVWLTDATVPASGLEPPLWTLTLHLYSFLTAEETTVDVVKDSPNPVPDNPGTVVYAGRDRILVGVGDESRASSLGDSGILFDGTGEEIMRFTTGEIGAFSDELRKERPLLTEHSILLNGSELGIVMDVRTGGFTTLENANLRIVPNTGCDDRGALYDPVWLRDLVLVDDTPGGLAVNGGPELLARDAQVVRPGLVASSADDAIVAVQRSDGSLAWSLGDDILTRFDVFGGYVVATNRSGQRVVIDPTNGADVTGVDPVRDQALEMLEGVYDRTNQVIWNSAFDSPTGSVVIVSEGRAARFDLNVVCPR